MREFKTGEEAYKYLEKLRKRCLKDDIRIRTFMDDDYTFEMWPNAVFFKPTFIRFGMGDEVCIHKDDLFKLYNKMYIENENVLIVSDENATIRLYFEEVVTKRLKL